MSKLEERLQLRFPRTAGGWKRLFWLGLGCCPKHHKRLLSNEPWDSMKYGMCCEGVSYWRTGFLLNLHMNYLAEKQP